MTAVLKDIHTGCTVKVPTKSMPSVLISIRYDLISLIQQAHWEID